MTQVIQPMIRDILATIEKDKILLIFFLLVQSKRDILQRIGYTESVLQVLKSSFRNLFAAINFVKKS